MREDCKIVSLAWIPRLLWGL